MANISKEVYNSLRAILDNDFLTVMSSQKWDRIRSETQKLFDYYKENNTDATVLEEITSNLKELLLETPLQKKNKSEEFVEGVISQLQEKASGIKKKEELAAAPKAQHPSVEERIGTLTSLTPPLEDEPENEMNLYMPRITPIEVSNFQKLDPKEPLKTLRTMSGRELYQTVFAGISSDSRHELFDILANYTNEMIHTPPIKDSTHEALKLRVEYQGYAEQAEDIVQKVTQYVRTNSLTELISKETKQASL